MIRTLSGLVGLLCVAAVASAQPAASTQPAAGLKIIVVEGEDGVNIVKKGTAVAPVVEVRDRNNLPVAGAVVTFAIPGGSKAASFAGNARQLAVATDSSGRATASLQAVGKGAFRVDISASYQGETATTSITQTNFASAAEAAKAGKTPGSQQSSGNASNGSNASNSATQSATTTSGSAGGAASAAGGAGGGGLSTGAITGIAVAGGAAVAGAVYIPKLIDEAKGPQCTSEESRLESTANGFLTADQNYLNCAVNTRNVCTAQFNAFQSAVQTYFQAAGDLCTCFGPEFASQLSAADKAAVQQAFNELRSEGFNLGTLPSCYR
jgi:hypothetical protein